MMRACVVMKGVQCEVETDSQFASDPLDDMVNRLQRLAIAMHAVEKAAAAVEDEAAA